MTAPATVTRIHAHVCPYQLTVGGVVRSASSCHYWQILSMDPPAPKRGRVA